MTGLELTIERSYKTHSHDTKFKITGLVKRFSKRRNMFSGRIHCCYIILTKTKDSSLFFSGGSEGKESACNAGDPGMIPEWGRSPGGGNPLKCSSLEIPMDGGTWQAIVHAVAKSLT